MSDLNFTNGLGAVSLLTGGGALFGAGAGALLDHSISRWNHGSSYVNTASAGPLTSNLVLDKWGLMELGLDKKGRPLTGKKLLKAQKKLAKRKAKRWWERGTQELGEWRDEDWNDYMTQGLPSEQELFDQFAAGSTVDPMKEIGLVTDRVSQAYNLYPEQLQRQRFGLGLNPLREDEVASENRRVGLDRAISIVDAQNRALDGAEARSDETMNFAAQVFGTDMMQANQMLQGLAQTELARKIGYKKANAQKVAGTTEGLGSLAGMALGAMAFM